MVEHADFHKLLDAEIRVEADLTKNENAVEGYQAAVTVRGYDHSTWHLDLEVEKLIAWVPQQQRRSIEQVLGSAELAMMRHRHGT